MSYSDQPDAASELGQLLLWLLPIPIFGFALTASEGSQGEFGALYLLSTAGLICGIVVLFAIYGASLIAGQNRDRLAYVFAPSIRIMFIALAISILCQAALFVFGIFELEAQIFGRVHVGILLALSLGAIGACFTLVSASLRFLGSSPMAVRGIPLSLEAEPRIWGAVRQSAEKLSSIVPDNIIVGLEPNFYVTSSDVNLIGQNRTISGNTLYLSSSLMRVLSEKEFLSVVGHELGHFRGGDLKYSQKFAPAYARMGHAFSGLSSFSESAADFAKLPALAALSTCLNRFASAERSIGRLRELEADKAGAEVAGANELAMALLKVSAYTDYWSELTQLNIREIGNGKFFTNLSSMFASICMKQSTDMDWSGVQESLLASQQPHPIDTHPPISLRVEALGVDSSKLQINEKSVPELSAILLLDDAVSAEEGLSYLEVKWLEAIGAVEMGDMPEEPDPN